MINSSTAAVMTIPPLGRNSISSSSNSSVDLLVGTLVQLQHGGVVALRHFADGNRRDLLLRSNIHDGNAVTPGACNVGRLAVGSECDPVGIMSDFNVSHQFQIGQRIDIDVTVQPAAREQQFLIGSDADTVSGCCVELPLVSLL